MNKTKWKKMKELCKRCGPYWLPFVTLESLGLNKLPENIRRDPQGIPDYEIIVHFQSKRVLFCFHTVEFNKNVCSSNVLFFSFKRNYGRKLYRSMVEKKFHPLLHDAYEVILDETSVTCASIWNQQVTQFLKENLPDFAKIKSDRVRGVYIEW